MHALRYTAPDSCLYRLRSVHTQAGAWGKFLSCILLGGWGINMLLGDHTIAHWPAICIITGYAGPRYVGSWFVVAAVLPMVALAWNKLSFMLITTGFALVTWFVILFEAVITGSEGRAAFWTCLVGIAAMLNAEVELARRILSQKDG